MAKMSDSIRVSRRKFMKASAATGAALAAGSVFVPAAHAAKTFKIGYVSPQTGPLAAFAEADNFVISNFLDTVKDGVKVGSATLPVEVAVKDSQSNPNRAAEVAKELIVPDKIDLMLVAVDAGDDQSGRDPMRDRGSAVHLDQLRRGNPVSSAVRPIRPAGRRHGSRSTTPITSSGASKTSSRSSPTCGDSCETNKIGRRACSRMTATATPGATSRSGFRRRSTRPATS